MPKNAIAKNIFVIYRGQWTEALDQIEHALRLGGDDFQKQAWLGLTESLIWAVAAGHGPRVKRMMEEGGLTEPMEPLWHAVREELGEALEPSACGDQRYRDRNPARVYRETPLNTTQLTLSPSGLGLFLI